MRPIAVGALVHSPSVLVSSREVPRKQHRTDDLVLCFGDSASFIPTYVCEPDIPPKIVVPELDHEEVCASWSSWSRRCQWAHILSPKSFDPAVLRILRNP